MVEDKLAEDVLRGKYGMGDTVVIDLVNGELTMTAKPRAEIVVATPTAPVEAGKA